MITNLDRQQKLSGNDWISNSLIFCSDGRLFKSHVLIGTSGANASLKHMTTSGEWENDIYQDGFSETQLRPISSGGNLKKQVDQKHIELKASAESLTEYLPEVQEK